MTDKNTGDDADDTSYADRGADNIEDLTRSDEAAMDRAAQAGVSGAFDAAGSEQLREEMRDDARHAFDTGQSS